MWKCFCLLVFQHVRVCVCVCVCVHQPPSRLRLYLGTLLQQNRADGCRAVSEASVSAQASKTTKYDPVCPDSVNMALYECECLMS